MRAGLIRVLMRAVLIRVLIRAVTLAKVDRAPTRWVEGLHLSDLDSMVALQAAGHRDRQRYRLHWS